MKTYIVKLFILSLSLVAIQSCKKSLQETPHTFVSPEELFAKASGYEDAVKGIYATVPGVLNHYSMMMREMFSDIYGSPFATAEQALPTYQNNHQPFFYNVRGEWENDYEMVKNANFVLSYLPKSNGILTDEQQKTYEGEARFLRAFAYFQLVQFYGAVPLRTEAITDYNQVQIGRSSEADVYKLIMEDLNFAQANLPDAALQTGRVYKLVATALLAKVYLTMAGNPLKQTQYYQDALDNALVVIKSNKFQLVEDYAKLFHTITYTPETIWGVLFKADEGGSGMHGLCSPAPGFAPILLPATWFINSFSAGDQRKVWGIQENYMAPGNNKLAPFFQKFVNNAYIDNGSTPSGVIDAYAYQIMRLGEMYLIAAEAENEVHGPAEAYQYINKLRWRARVDKSNPEDVPDLAGLSKDAFRDSVLMERKHELYLEGSTWFDLKRTNTLNRIQEIRGNTLTHPIGAYNNTWYIPDVEITNNNIEQNPAYK